MKLINITVSIFLLAIAYIQDNIYMAVFYVLIALLLIANVIYHTYYKKRLERGICTEHDTLINEYKLLYESNDELQKKYKELQDDFANQVKATDECERLLDNTKKRFNHELQLGDVFKHKDSDLICKVYGLDLVNGRYYTDEKLQHHYLFEQDKDLILLYTEVDKMIYDLYKLLDDIDTTSDIYKENYKLRCKKIDELQQKRHEIVNEDIANIFYDKFYRQEDDILTGEKEIPFAEPIHQCYKCGSDNTRETLKLWICNDCGARENKLK